MKYLTLDQCKNKYLYLIKARNSFLGVFNKEKKSFTISRVKFKLNYLFEEDHWDTGEPFGTVKPLKEIEPVSIELFEQVNDDEKLKFLNEYQIKVEKEARELIKEFSLTEEETML